MGSMITRRTALAFLSAALATPARGQGMSRASAYAFAFTRIDGERLSLMDYAGRPILIVNTASQCGYTPQYAGLQELWTRYRERGLMVIGVPSNDFGGQEPGGAGEILQTAHQVYGVTFPLAAKVEVKGASPHPFYRWAALERPFELPGWNFYKYLIGRDGRIAGTFGSEVAPGDPRLVAAIEKELPPG
jgi:glutathione peroxidase